MYVGSCLLRWCSEATFDFFLGVCACFHQQRGGSFDARDMGDSPRDVWWFTAGCWFESLWTIWVRELGWLFPIYYGKINEMFQTTKQLMIYGDSWMVLAADSTNSGTWCTCAADRPWYVWILRPNLPHDYPKALSLHPEIRQFFVTLPKNPSEKWGENLLEPLSWRIIPVWNCFVVVGCEPLI